MLPIILILLALIYPCVSFAAADPSALPKTKAVLDYLLQLPSLSSNRVVSGQFSGGQNYLSTDCAKVYQQTGYWPGLIGVDYSPIYGGNENDFSAINNLLIDYSNNGGLVHIFMHSRNPNSNKFFNSDGSRDMSNVDFVQLITSGTPLNTAWKKELDRVATGLSQLQANNVVVLFRPFHEMNGGWFWWGAKDPQQFKNAWIYSFNYLTLTKGLHNLLWVYGPNAGSDAANYYPGSQYVDIVGLDYYGVMNVPQVSGYTALLAFNKPIALTEFGPCSPDGSNCGPQDSTPLIAGIRQNMPKLTFWMSYGDVWSISHHLNAKQLLQDSWVVTRDEISLSGTPPADATPPQAPKGLTVQ